MRHTKKMKSWFLKRGYPENIIKREIEKVKFKKQVFRKRGRVTNCDATGDNVSFFTQVSGYYFVQTFISATYG